MAFWAGGAAIFTFVLTRIIFRSYDRDMAGRSRLPLPGLFPLGARLRPDWAWSLLALRGRNFVPSLIIIVVMLALTSLGAFYIEPKAAALKKEIPSFVTTPKDHPLRKVFSRLHGISAAADLLVIGGGVALVILL